MNRTKRVGIAVVLCVTASCGAPPIAPPPVAEVAKPPAPKPVAPAPPAAPVRLAREIEMPTAPCVVEADRPQTGPSTLGIAHVFVGGVPIAHTMELGAIRHAKLVFSEARKGLAAVEVDGELVSIRGATPTKTDTTDDLELFPKTRIVRAGWLSYGVVHVASVDGASVDPSLTLPPWLVPEPSFAATPFRVPCTDLSPFHATTVPTPLTAELRGRRVPLEDAGGKRVAVVLGQPPEPKGKGKDADDAYVGPTVKVLETKGKRSKILVELGNDFAAEGWVAARSVREVLGAAVGYGTGGGSGRRLGTLTCDEEVPLWVTLRDSTFVVGAVHAKATVRGVRTGTGDFRVVIGSGAPAIETETKDAKLSATDPFVPVDRLTKCREGNAEPPKAP